MSVMIEYIKELLFSVAPEAPLYPEVVELNKTVDDIQFSELLFAVKKYIKKNISHTHTFLGINYISHNSIEIITSVLDHKSSRHGYGNSHDTICKFILNIKELGF